MTLDLKNYPLIIAMPLLRPISVLVCWLTQQGNLLLFCTVVESHGVGENMQCQDSFIIRFSQTPSLQTNEFNCFSFGRTLCWLKFSFPLLSFWKFNILNTQNSVFLGPHLISPGVGYKPTFQPKNLSPTSKPFHIQVKNCTKCKSILELYFKGHCTMARFCVNWNDCNDSGPRRTGLCLKS